MMVAMVSNETTVWDGEGTPEPGAMDRLLPRHPLSRLSGELTPVERGSLIVELSGSARAVEVDVLDGRVIYDWHRYEVAMELEKTIVYNQVADDDPAGYLIVRLVGGRSLSGGQCAAIEVTLRSWQPTGRPKKTAKNADLAGNPSPTMTANAMAAEAHVCETYIRMAKRVHRNGGEEVIRQVIGGELSQSVADAMLSESKREKRSAGTGSSDAAQAGRGEKPAIEQIDVAVPAVPSNDGAAVGANNDDADVDADPSWVVIVLGLMAENRRLKRANRDLERETRFLSAQLVKLSSLRLKVARQEGSRASAPVPAPATADPAGTVAKVGGGAGAGDDQIRLDI